MPRNVIPRSELQFVEAVSRLAFCNVFLEERIDLEREALGGEYEETDPVWNFLPHGLRDDPNVNRLVERVGARQLKVEILPHRRHRKI